MLKTNSFGEEKSYDENGEFIETSTYIDGEKVEKLMSSHFIYNILYNKSNGKSAENVLQWW